MLATRHRDSRCADLLIAAGANVNKQGKDGRTPIMEATIYGQYGNVEILIKAGADVHIQDHEGKTALMWAASYGQDKCGAILIGAGADVNEQNNQGRTALMLTVIYGYDHFLKLLINTGADVNMCDIFGDTPLLKALKDYIYMYPGDVTMKFIKTLLGAGSHVNIVNKRGQGCRMAISCLLQTTGDFYRPLIIRCLIAAGDTLNEISSLQQGTQTFVSLSHLCRETIRTQLLDLDPHENLFVRMPRLGLPAALQRYLLFDETLGDEEGENM